MTDSDSKISDFCSAELLSRHCLDEDVVSDWKRLPGHPFAAVWCDAFIKSQRIDLWWNSTESNAKGTSLFNDALVAILAGKFDEAGQLRLQAFLAFLKWPLTVCVCLAFLPLFLGGGFEPFVFFFAGSLGCFLGFFSLRLFRVPWKVASVWAFAGGWFTASRELELAPVTLFFGWAALLLFMVLWMVMRSITRLLYVETKFFCRFLDTVLPNPDDGKWPFSIVPMDPNGERYRQFLKGVWKGLPRSFLLGERYAEFYEFCRVEIGYKSLATKNCVVCATMSAGKSTFVNALLGMDVLPSRNSATTAKVTSICDRDGMQGLIGFTQNDSGERSDLYRVDANVLEKWNSDATISQIFLQGDFDGIANQGFKVMVHDTPGTNNSGDSRHHAITREFLGSVCPSVLVYVANAEHLCTTDDYALLKEIFDLTVRPHGTPVVFVLNKADSIDPQKESLETQTEQYKTFLANIGFVNPSVYPVSSKAARLLKMAIKGRAGSFTEAELDDFPSIVRSFTKRLVFGKTVLDRSVSNGPTTIVVDGESYDFTVLCEALAHTGIQEIESILENHLTSDRKDD